MIRAVIPHHLRTLAGTGAVVALRVDPPVTQRAVLDALEAQYPMLKGTIRDPVTHKQTAVPAFLRLQGRPVARAARRALT